MNNMNQDDDERTEYGKKAGWVDPVAEETRDCQMSFFVEILEA